MTGYQNQPFQATYMKGEVNFTVRGESKNEVMLGLKMMIKDWRQWVGSQGTQSVSPPSDPSGVKCPVCGSSTHDKVVNKKDGTQVVVQECDNTNCKTSLNFTTGQYEPGKFRTTIWPKN